MTDGPVEGFNVGLDVGLLLGASDGLSEGTEDGLCDGSLLGLDETVGRVDGLVLGTLVGKKDGDSLGNDDGDMEGLLLGVAEGVKEGLLLGAKERVGETLGDTEVEGGDEGLAVGLHPLPFPDRLHDFLAYSSLSKRLSTELSYCNMSSFHAKSFRWIERFLFL